MELKIKKEIADYLDENVMSKKKSKKIGKLLYNKEAIEKEIDNYENKINELEKENQKYIDKIDIMKEKNKDLKNDIKEKEKELEDCGTNLKILTSKLRRYQFFVRDINPQKFDEIESMRKNI